MTRDELRAADQQFAELADMLRANGCEIRVSHYRFHDGRELGKPEPRDEFYISAESWIALQQHSAYVARGRK